MMGSLRSEVLKCFKKLHKTSHNIFNGDEHALGAIRFHINTEFKKNKDESDTRKIEDLIKYGHEVEHELRTTIIQAVEKRPGVYEARITADTIKEDNIPYRDCPSAGKPRKKGK